MANVIIGSDLVYEASPYKDLAELLGWAATNNPKLERILIVTPLQRKCNKEFLALMEEKGFSYEVTRLDDDFYHAPLFKDAKDSYKIYPGIMEGANTMYTTFDLFTFTL